MCVLRIVRTYVTLNVIHSRLARRPNFPGAPAFLNLGIYDAKKIFVGFNPEGDRIDGLHELARRTVAKSKI